eukprot:EG_transcript_57129
MSLVQLRPATIQPKFFGLALAAAEPFQIDLASSFGGRPQPIQRPPCLQTYNRGGGIQPAALTSQPICLPAFFLALDKFSGNISSASEGSRFQKRDMAGCVWEMGAQLIFLKQHF